MGHTARRKDQQPYMRLRSGSFVPQAAAATEKTHRCTAGTDNNTNTATTKARALPVKRDAPFCPKLLLAALKLRRIDIILCGVGDLYVRLLQAAMHCMHAPAALAISEWCTLAHLPSTVTASSRMMSDTSVACIIAQHKNECVDCNGGYSRRMATFHSVSDIYQ